MRGSNRSVEWLMGIRSHPAGPLWNRDTGTPRHLPHRGGIVHTGALHQPGKNVTRFVAHKTVVTTLLWYHREVSVGSPMKGARATVIRAGALELHRFADEPYDVRTVADLLNRLVGNHAHAVNSTMVTPVPP